MTRKEFEMLVAAQDAFVVDMDHMKALTIINKMLEEAGTEFLREDAHHDNQEAKQ